MLAIFECGADTHTAGICAAVLRAARRAHVDVEARNRTRLAVGEPPINFGLALHLGEVSYGNIGAPDRLDFTVIDSVRTDVPASRNSLRKLGRDLVYVRYISRRRERSAGEPRFPRSGAGSASPRKFSHRQSETIRESSEWTMVRIGNHMKISLRPEIRPRTRAFYWETLGLKRRSKARAINPLVSGNQFTGGFVLGIFFIYLTCLENVPPNRIKMKATWLELKVEDPQLWKEKMQDFGIAEVDYPDGSGLFDLQAPGGSGSDRGSDGSS